MKCGHNKRKDLDTARYAKSFSKSKYLPLISRKNHIKNASPSTIVFFILIGMYFNRTLHTMIVRSHVYTKKASICPNICL